MRQPPKIAASILSADLARMGEEAKDILAAGADWIHFDVMDNHYVPNLTFGPSVCQALRTYGIKATIDVHLMVEKVDSLIAQFANAGANNITFHPEASHHVDRSLQYIRDEGCKAGLAFNPATPLNLLPHVLDKIDLILLMSVNPGFSGQTFIPSVLDKIKDARKIIDESPYAIRLAVDGGINQETIGSIIQAGADTVIMGSFLFSSKNYEETINQCRRLIDLK